MKKTYTATATKAGKYWHIEVAQVNGVTQARSLEAADEMARDLVSILTDEVPESFDITLEVNLPEKAAEARQIAEELREKAAQYNGDAAVYNRRSVALLKKEGFSQKDIATALGISRQRAAQLSTGINQGGPRVLLQAKPARKVSRSVRVGKVRSARSTARSRVTQ